ncbi:hypothetical protein TSUD_287070 [Trifolium subterraneum]|uniref:Reverse transcriptase zinc-binding domain-containing protein n=1 Tax=Trifolium subterraneum TaxID=3900 RepID=A0A2Z6MWV9_TRISU|nr:hypothetical protein TSUD_287070 [Trifolium subterraneum]
MAGPRRAAEEGLQEEVVVFTSDLFSFLFQDSGRYESGGLGVRRVKEFNAALIDVFNVKGVYQSLTRAEDEAEPVLNSTELVWNQVVPIKVSVVAWCFMENQIPTRDNLFKRDILNIDAQHCVLGCGCDETLSPIFFACDLTHKVWCGILQCIKSVSKSSGWRQFGRHGGLEMIAILMVKLSMRIPQFFKLNYMFGGGSR